MTMHAVAHFPSAFDSTDPGTVMALENLQPISRTVLTFLHIDPGLARVVDRDRLRAVVKLVVANPSNDLIGFAINDLKKMWERGFPISAFDDDTRTSLDVSEATRLVVDLRNRLGTRWPDDEWERAHINRVMRLLGYERSNAPRVDAGGAP
jgi:hypothetical protein